MKYLAVGEVAAPAPRTTPPRRSALRSLPVLTCVQPLLTQHGLTASLHEGRLGALRPGGYPQVPAFDSRGSLGLLHFFATVFSLPSKRDFFYGRGERGCLFRYIFLTQEGVCRETRDIANTVGGGWGK